MRVKELLKKSINFFILTNTKLSDFISLNGSKAFRRSFCSQKGCVRLCRCDVMVFESLTLTPFCMEILEVRKWIIQCFNGVFSAILVGIR